MPKRSSDFYDPDGSRACVDARAIVSGCIKNFFAYKSGPDGGPLPPRELGSEASVRTVMLTPFDDDTFELIHERCLPSVPRQDWYRETTVSWGVHVLLGLLDEMKSLGIPKEFQPGMLLLYFKFCNGVDIGNG